MQGLSDEIESHKKHIARLKDELSAACRRQLSAPVVPPPTEIDDENRILSNFPISYVYCLSRINVHALFLAFPWNEINNFTKQVLEFVSWVNPIPLGSVNVKNI